MATSRSATEPPWRQHLQWLALGGDGAGPDRAWCKGTDRGAGRERVVAVEDFFTGPGCTVLEPGEIVAEIQVPEPPRGKRRGI